MNIFNRPVMILIFLCSAGIEFHCHVIVVCQLSHHTIHVLVEYGSPKGLF